MDVRVVQPVGPDDVAAVRRLAARAEAADGHPPFGDAVWRDLAHPTPRSAGLVAREAGEVVGYLHVAPARADDGERGDAVALGLVVDPRHRDGPVAPALVAAAVEHARRAGRPRLLLWVFGADDRSDRFAAAAGFALEREMRQLRVPLPLDERPRWPAGVRVRSFEPGHDEAEWLRVNNRAFAADPDQHGWTRATLQQRLEEPWFDPAGFLLAVDDAGIAGFCWTKVHPPSAPHEPDALGEIYVIGVDPGRQGAGLGRALVLAGLESLAARGLRVGMLFVDAANRPALALYRALGFSTTRVDRAYWCRP